MIVNTPNIKNGTKIILLGYVKKRKNRYLRVMGCPIPLEPKYRPTTKIVQIENTTISAIVECGSKGLRFV